MNAKATFWTAVLVLASVTCLSNQAGAQVIEERKGESNPSTVIFRATLYGVGTGLLLGGAYALVENDEDLTTGEILRWGAAGGAAAGLLVGLVHVITRPEPKGDVEEVGAASLDDPQKPRLRVPTVLVTEQRDILGESHGGLSVGVVRMTF